MAPQTGRLVSELVTGATPNVDMRPYRSGRFN
jgi:glycine/D-amino acid oxidase-like deaminating enzyme